jgi:methyl-accepting chemotaxis protein
VVEAIQQVTGIMAGITTASQEQTAGIEQVRQAVVHMDGMTQQNASLVEESAAASESLYEQADALVQAVKAFKLDGTPAAVKAKATVVSMPGKAMPAARPADEPLQAKRLASGSAADWTEF